jgi:DNA repair photolyase
VLVCYAERVDGELPQRKRLRGRGAVTQPAPRFEPTRVEPFDDGWDSAAEDLDQTSTPTVVTEERSRSVISQNDSPDIPFDRSINPYKGCEHGCVYCFARPTHAYLGLSPGIDFETRIVAKPEAPARLRETFAKPGYRPQVIALGANTDPYQPAERQRGLTRQLLEVFWEHRHPVLVITKSAGALRDLDLLAQLAAEQLAAVRVSLTTLDPTLARGLEPRAPTPGVRLKLIAALREAEVPVGVLTSPVIPALNDGELEQLLAAAAEAGAQSAGYALLRLPREVGPIMEAWLEEHAPERKERVLSLVRQCHGGKLYDASFGRRMPGQGPYATLLRQRYLLACRRLGLVFEDGTGAASPLSTERFVVPGSQLALF